MERNIDIESILFPVTTVPIYHELLSKEPYQQPLFEETSLRNRMEHIKGYKAILNEDTGQVFSIVSDEYRLVTNEEALDLGKECFRKLFGSVEITDLEVFNIIVPKSKSFCHIDLIHRNYAVNVWAKEVWLPYLRITNSYNRKWPLRFDLGFCRKLCDNGCIFESETIPYKFHHTRMQISPFGQFQVDFEKLKALETSFTEMLSKMKSFEVDKEYAVPLACKALGLQFDIHNADAKRKSLEVDRLAAFRNLAKPLADQYFAEHGSNAYSELNLITDLASRPAFYRQESWMINTLQKRAGTWLVNFSRELTEPKFSLDLYLKDVNSWFPTN